MDNEIEKIGKHYPPPVPTVLLWFSCLVVFLIAPAYIGVWLLMKRYPWVAQLLALSLAIIIIVLNGSESQHE